MGKLPSLSDKELQKKNELDISSKDDVTPEDYFLAEIGYYFGWGAIVSIEKDEITLDEAEKLLRATRKVWYRKLYEQGTVNFYASKDGKSFNNYTRKIFKMSEVKDE